MGARNPTTSRASGRWRRPQMPPPSPGSALPEKAVHPPTKPLAALPPRSLVQQLDRRPAQDGGVTRALRSPASGRSHTAGTAPRSTPRRPQREQERLIWGELASKPVEERSAVLRRARGRALDPRPREPGESDLLPDSNPSLAPSSASASALDRILVPGLRRPRFELQRGQQRLAGVPVLSWIPDDRGPPSRSAPPRIRERRGPAGAPTRPRKRGTRGERASAAWRSCSEAARSMNPPDRGNEVGIASS